LRRNPLLWILYYQRPDSSRPCIHLIRILYFLIIWESTHNWISSIRKRIIWREPILHPNQRSSTNALWNNVERNRCVKYLSLTVKNVTISVSAPPRNDVTLCSKHKGGCWKSSAKLFCNSRRSVTRYRGLPVTNRIYGIDSCGQWRTTMCRRHVRSTTRSNVPSVS